MPQRMTTTTAPEKWIAEKYTSGPLKAKSSDGIKVSAITDLEPETVFFFKASAQNLLSARYPPMSVDTDAVIATAAVALPRRPPLYNIVCAKSLLPSHAPVCASATIIHATYMNKGTDVPSKMTFLMRSRSPLSMSTKVGRHSP